MADIQLDPEETDGLFPPAITQAPIPYLRRLWELRFFMMAEARGKLASGHSDLALGRGWLVLEPLLYISVYFVLFGLALRSGRDLNNIDFLSYLVVGKISFQFLQRGILGSGGALRGQTSGALDCPRATLPLGHVLKGALAYRFELLVMLSIVLIRGYRPNVTWILVVPLFALMLAFVIGAGLVLARMISRFPDIHPVFTHIMRLAFYSSGIIFPIEIILRDTDNGLFWLRLYTLANPLFAFVKLHQGIAFGYEPVPIGYAIASVALWSLTLLIGGFLWFIRGENRYQSAAISSRSLSKSARS